MTQSVEVSSSPEMKHNQQLLQVCKKFLLHQISRVSTSCLTFKEPNRVSFVEDQAQTVPLGNFEAAQANLGVQKFILIKPGSVEKMGSDIKWKNNLVTLCKCVREFLAPSCYWNKHWKLSRDDLTVLFEFAFVALRVSILWISLVP